MLRQLVLLFSLIASTTLAGVNIANDETNGRQCTVTALGNNQSDVPNILKAFSACNHGGTVIFPEHESYWIDQRLNPILNDVTIQWKGIWTLSPNVTYWRANGYPIAFQNHQAGIVFTGDGIHIDGFSTGGIDGNGDVWYALEGSMTKPGRPMPFVFWNVSDVTVSRFFVRQPPLWSINIMNGTDMVFDDIYVNATVIKSPPPFGTNYLQNTDGFDTMDARNIRLSNFVYQGGDDCVAIKSRSYNIHLSNLTCHGGMGPAIGSLGQYLEDSTVENVYIDGVTVMPSSQLQGYYGLYIKTWIGVQLLQGDNYESAGQPRGAGWGVVRNIAASNVKLVNARAAIYLSQDSGAPVINNTVSGTSLMQVSNVAVTNVTGYFDGREAVGYVSCSKLNPCYNLDMRNVTVYQSNVSEALAQGLNCRYVEDGGTHGETC